MAPCPHLSEVRPLFDHPMRDPSICVGPDDYYYLTGTTGAPDWWTRNDGIDLWRSHDLVEWENLGQVWAIDDGTWQRDPVSADGVEMRAVWAPEIHFIKETYWLAYCIPGRGSSLLRSVNGTAEGPYEDVDSSGPLVPREIDGSLFEDDDGSVWFVCGGGLVARLTDDLTALASEPFRIRPADHGHVGFEGAFLLKRDGRYHLFAAEFVDPDRGPVDLVSGMNEDGLYYACLSASAENLAGPWSERYVVGEHLGHNMVFLGRDGIWRSTYFGNDACAPVRERPAVVPLGFDDDARWKSR